MKFVNQKLNPQLIRIPLLMLSILLGLIVTSCDPKDDDILNPPTGSTTAEYYALCEGTFTQANASLWSFDETLDTVRGPLVWDTDMNLMGDVGQSLTLHENTLYIVMNNSHQVRMLDLENGPQHIGDIDLPNASPRSMAIQTSKNRGFISSWNNEGLLVVDLATNSVSDTLLLNGLPEEVLIDGDRLFVSMTLHTDWTAHNQVIQLDISSDNPVITNSYTVLNGPGSMALFGNELYVTSISYDPVTYAANTGTSRIDLADSTILSVDYGTYGNYTADIDIIDGIPYRVYGNSIIPLNTDLSLDLSGGIGDHANVYSFSVQNGNAIVATSDFISPDSVYVYSALGENLATIPVAAFPGDVIFYDPATTNTN